MSRIQFLLSTMFIVNSCGFYEAYEGGQAGKDYQALLLGMTPEELTRCAGNPVQRKSQGSSEVWTYQHDFYKYNPTDRKYIGFADVEFRGDEVVDVKYRSNFYNNTLGLPIGENAVISQSTPIFERC